MMKKTGLFLLIGLLFTFSCSKTEEPGKDPNPQKNFYTQTFYTSGVDFTEEFNPRVQLDNTESLQKNVDQLKSYFINDIEHENLLTNLTFSGFVQTMDNDTGNHLCLGSKNSDGKMTWFSGKKIYKVEANVINYYKTWSNSYNSGVSTDSDSHFVLDGDNHSLQIASGTIPTETNLIKTYKEGVYQFSFASTNGRVLVESFAITWEV